MESSHHITPAGLEKLRQEHGHLYREVRPRLLEEIARAAAMGDRSENAEYIYGKRKLREVDKRLRLLSRNIENAKVVSNEDRNMDRVYFGAEVDLKPESGGPIWTVRIVGAQEIDPLAGRVSKDSPVGKAIMGRTCGDTVEVVTPKGAKRYLIESYRYS